MIRLRYGSQQRFRFRYRDVTLPGHVDAPMPLRSATYRLDDGPPVRFYVEELSEPPGLDWRFGYKPSPARLRLPHRGDFNIEIPVTSLAPQAGSHRVAIDLEDAAGGRAHADVAFTWDPTPVSLPLDLTDLSKVTNIQQVGQVVNGAFDLDPGRSAVRARAPVAPDALLLLGAPSGSQEATYDVVFSEPDTAKYLGLSDFFVGHEEEDPPLGIKPGWSTAGLATLTYGWRPGSPAEVGQRPAEPVPGSRPEGQARAWLACSDNSRRRERWLVKTDPPARVGVEAGVRYRVRHQVLFEEGVNRVRFRIWPAGDREPASWLCEIDDAGAPSEHRRFSAASFGLFQHTGRPTEWSSIRVVALGRGGNPA
ncbi:MAG: hypothetical protein ACREMB_10875 [Candidatus Rokuibacteriota bacterium]